MHAVHVITECFKGSHERDDEWQHEHKILDVRQAVAYFPPLPLFRITSVVHALKFSIKGVYASINGAPE